MDKLRWWNRKIFGWLKIRVDEYVKYLNSLDNQMVFININNIEECKGKRGNTSRSIWDNIHLKESIIREKNQGIDG